MMTRNGVTSRGGSRARRWKRSTTIHRQSTALVMYRITHSPARMEIRFGRIAQRTFTRTLATSWSMTSRHCTRID